MNNHFTVTPTAMTYLHTKLLFILSCYSDIHSTGYKWLLTRDSLMKTSVSFAADFSTAQVLPCPLTYFL